MEFKERYTAPTNTEAYRTNNPFYPKFSMFKNNGNCTDYAYYRFKEAQGIYSCDLPTSNAENWIVYNTKYKEGRTAKIGAVIVWSKGKLHDGKDGAGHVGFVERVNPDGSIVVSESGYRSFLWRRHIYNKNYSKFGYAFQGFIYPEVEFNDSWSAGEYKLLKSKAIRNSHEITNNILKVKQIGAKNKKNLTSNNPNSAAYYKAGTILNVKSIYKESNGRIWGELTGAWIVLCNKDGSKQAIKID